MGQVPNAGHGWLVALGLYHVYGVLCAGSGSVRVAGAVGIDADAHSLQRHEHRAGTEPDGVDDTGGNFLALRQQVWIFAIFFLFAGFTVIYLLIVAIFLPETKGKTLEEIEEYFDKPKRGRALAS